MAILGYFRVLNSTPTSPASPEPPWPAPESAPNRMRTKIILPKKKAMKWTSGTSPGDYGGPPTTTKLRKYWGGNQEDPVTSSDLIWNKDFMPRMEKFLLDKSGPSSSSAPYPPAKKESSGFLSLSRAMSLDSMEVDLSASLISSQKVSKEQHDETTQVTVKATQRWKLAPTRKEQDKWDRATKAATGGTDVMFRELRNPRGDPQVLAAQALEKYEKLKKKLQVVTMGIGGVGLVSAYVCYTPEIAASGCLSYLYAGMCLSAYPTDLASNYVSTMHSFSFGAGLIGSLVYIRMLGSTVDSMANASGGLIKGAAGQPRLLVPVILVMVFNRWNQIAVPEYGLMQLELIPMLVGFFTYKIATFFQAIDDAVFTLRNDSQT